MGRTGLNGNKPTTANNLTGYLELLVDEGHFRNYGEIAEECAMEPSLLSHIQRDPQRRLSVEQCLRLANKIGEKPSTVLRQVGRKTEADLLDALWPTKHHSIHLTRKEREHLQQWRQLTLKDKHHLDAIINICVQLVAASTAGPRGTSRGGGRAVKRTRSR